VRGALIDTDALIEAIDTGIVGRAGPDVLDGEMTMVRTPNLDTTEQVLKELHSGGGATQRRRKL
jgi:lactate dehydrogenase-like 2-hydroxyacid dehydrogenase